MSDPETPTQPLIRAPSQQTAVNVEAPAGGSSRAYKIAGLTLLACVLIVGQAMTAYFLLSQRNDIKSLKEQDNKLRSDMSKGRSVSVPIRMHMPMNALSDLSDAAMKEETSTGATEASSVPLTKCQREAAGLLSVPVPGFRPACDRSGNYKIRQCYVQECWCVKPETGEQTGCDGVPTFLGRMVEDLPVEPELVIN